MVPSASTPAPRSVPAGGRKYIRRGKVKEVYELSPTELEFQFTDDISVFDKKVPNQIPHKGETLTRTATHWFKLCDKVGVHHHFLGETSPTSFRVRRVNVVPQPRTLGPNPKSYLVPLEFITRYFVAGS